MSLLARNRGAARQRRAGAFLETLVQDVRYGARSLAARPGFTAAAAIALALGLGANTALFSVANAVLLRPLAYASPERLTVILHQGRNPVAPANFLDWQRDARSFAGMGAAEYWEPNVGAGDAPERAVALRVTSDIIPLLGVSPRLGRAFVAEEDTPGRDHVAVLSHALWQRRFGGDPGIVGRSITLDGEAYTVIGVMPPSFGFAPFWATRAQLWVPLALGSRAASRVGNSLRVFARLAPGTTLEQARAEMSTITARLEREYPGTNREVVVMPLRERVVGDVRPAVVVLLGAVTLVLLIACANVAHMLLARAAGRQREMAVRTALGATRRRLVRQLLVESGMLALLGGALGLLLAIGAIRAVVAFGPADVPRLGTVAIDMRALGFLCVVSLVTGIGFGLVPALRAAGTGDALRDAARGSTEGRAHGRVRGALVASELAVAVIVLVAAGLMIRSMVALQAIDPGFDPRNVLSVVVSVAGAREEAPALRAPFYQQLVERVRATPGVIDASAINHLPLGGDLWGRSFFVEGRPLPPAGDEPGATYRVVLPGYFGTMRIPLLEGRDLTASDRRGADQVVVINEFMARRYWPGQSAIGKRLTIDDPRANDQPAWLTVVGVVKNDVRGEWIDGPAEEMFLPYLQRPDTYEGVSPPRTYLTLVVRTTGDPVALAGPLRAAVSSLDPAVTVADVRSMEQVVAEATARPRFYVLLLGAFAAVALALSAVGIYGVMSHVVSRRTHEIGIRMALGARPTDALALVIGQSMGVAVLGVVVGMVGALALTRLMATLLYGVRPTDPVTFAAAPLVLLMAALAASWLPARRATRIDPLEALRAE